MTRPRFCETLKKARVNAGLTQAELAQKLGVTQATISTYETGRIDPDASTRKRIRDVIGILGTEPGTANDGAETSIGGVGSAFGTWLVKTRIAKGFTLAELSKRSGLSIPGIWRIEAGHTEHPRTETVQLLERALEETLSAETQAVMKEEATVEGLGEFTDFDPHRDEDRPSSAGVYVLYDVSERPIYVGMGSNIQKRLRDHQDKFWFKSPIVDSGSFISISDNTLRRQVETILIRFLKSNAVINKQNVDRE